MSLDPLSHLTSWNPLPGLTESVLRSRLEEGERGDYARLQWTFRAIERRDATARAIKAKLKGALRSLDWKIKVRDGLSPAQAAAAEAQATTLRTAYEGVENLRDAIVHLALADFRGYAHCAKVYAGAPSQPSTFNAQLPTDAGSAAQISTLNGQLSPDPWSVVELRPVPQWHLSRRGYDTPWTYDPQARFGSAMGTPIVPRDWIAHEVEDPVDEILAACSVQAVSANLHWEAFLKTYGAPALFVLGPPNVARDPAVQYQAVADAVISDGRGYLPHGSDVRSVAPPSGHSEVFAQRLGYLQKLMVLAGTGGLLSMLAEPTGIGKGASDAHDNTWLTIAAGVAAGVSETLQAQFDLPELQRRYGPAVEPLAWFELARPEKEDTAALAATVQSLSAAGYRFDPAELSAKFGYRLEASADAASGSNRPAGGAASDGADNATRI